MLGALALGAAAALLALLTGAALVAVRRRRSRGIPTLQALSVAALAASLLLAGAVQALRTPASPTTAPAQSAAAAAFARWQHRVVPVVVAYVSVVRADAALLRTLPGGRRQSLRAQTRAGAGAATLRRVHATLPPIARSVSRQPDLARLTRTLDTSLELAQQGQSSTVAALAARAHGQAAVRALLARARRTMRRSQQTMASFTLQANALGAQLNAGP